MNCKTGNNDCIKIVFDILSRNKVEAFENVINDLIFLDNKLKKQ
jgi:hypothetical protein